ncbi:beta-ketoacyl synthase N-terminal-like domain-containing protein [Streptomyces sp. GS7]|uniref:beta-ketoacyl synthase N-terminal-like domain-containing protein n=1 Tax=Streptomyces sp. GS7 TaxID=2692234 RepID=UPI0013183BC8|nr:beta-ketoacyl synthase N-terminal-like domain-containing protein [Streptomyces sp. GS7]QHC20443.1 KR domain-containing protein [Streptomyces sp. GS7]
MQPRTIRLALPHMAVGGLSENWLFKECGDLHWQLLGEHFGVPVTELRDARGDRLLPVFVRIATDARQPLSAFREGDAVTLTGRLTRLDERTFAGDTELRAGERVVTARLMTVFAKRTAGGALAPVVPRTGGADGPSASEGVDESLLAFQRGFMAARQADPARPLEPAEAGGELFRHVYDLNPYYDLNGAGLLYFASYPHINDHCERLYFHTTGLPADGDGRGADWSGAASTVARDVLYLGNCGPDDAVVYRLDSCRFDGGRVHLASTLLRESDGAPLARIRTLKELTGCEAPEAPVRRAGSADGDRTAAAGLAARLLPVMARALDVPADRLTDGTDLRELGLDSFTLSAFAHEATGELGTEVDPSRLFQSFTVADLARVVAREQGLERGHEPGREAAGPAEAPRPAPRQRAARPRRRPRRAGSDEIAVVGLAGRFPGADTAAELWRVLAEGRETIGEIPADRWERHTAGGEPDGPGQVAGRGGFLADIRRFDHSFFRVSPREAELMDPQQRLFLEVAWEAFEDAGHDVTRLRGSRTGVFVGVCHSDYAAVLRERLRTVEPHRSVATSPSVVANRVSFAFGFHGSSVAVDTLCSSSLVAVDQAVRALRDGSCEQALVGGVNVICDPGQHRAYARTGVLSADGRCRTFDEAANGYVRGEGVCALVLKPLRQARADGDQVYAVIKSAAVNHGGQAQSLTAPNADAQAALLKQAYEAAGIDPATVGYLEAHGTGTVLGDPIEIAGVVGAFEQLHRDREQPLPPEGHCGIGSLKTNIGHLEAAAGVAGMIKVMLAMRHGVLPATRNFTRLNHRIRLAGSPFRIQSEQTPWHRFTDADGRPVPRRAGVSSFGMGGTNAHVVLEEFLEPASRDGGAPGADDGPYVVPLSARTPDALADAARNLLAFLDGSPDDGPRPHLAAVAHTLQTGRAQLPERLAAVASSLDELRRVLRGWLAGERDADAASAPGALARRWEAGAEIDWAAEWGARTRPGRVSLPTYPFRRDRHWVAAVEPAVESAEEPAEKPLVAEEFLARSWRADAAPAAGAPAEGAYLVLVDDASARAASALFARQGGAHRAITVHVADLTGQPGSLDAVLAAHGGLAGGERLAGIVDLADWREEGEEGEEGGAGGSAAVFRNRLVLLQELLAHHRLPSLTCLHVTRGPVATEAAGLYRMLSSEFRSVESRTVDVEFGPDRPEELAPVVAAELALRDRQTQVRHRAGRRECASLRFLAEEERAAAAAGASPLDEAAAGTVVITGGTGEIGLHLARELHRRGARHLLLIGRGRLPARAKWASLARDPQTDPRLARRLGALVELAEAGASVEVRTHALRDAASLRRLLDRTRQRHGPVTAVFHGAGAMDDSRFLLTKEPKDVQGVLDPKVRGVRTLWAALADQPPRLLALFSSISAAVPRLAVSYGDYAAANAFLDDFAAAHDGRGDCAVRSLQWPVWEDTGLGRGRGGAADELGIPALAVGDALALLDGALAVPGHPVLLPCRADRARLRLDGLLRAPERSTTAPAGAVGSAVVPAGAGAPAPDSVAAAAPARSGETDPAAVLAWLTGVFARTLKADPGTLPPAASFAELGVDSLLLAELVRELEGALGRPVDPTLVQQYPTLTELAATLAEQVPAAVRSAVGPGAADGAVDRAAHATGGAPAHGAGEHATVAPRPEAARAAGPVVPAGPVPIAVIGMACRFPGADAPATFWRNLVEGRSHVVEVPPERWDVNALYSPDGGPGKSISKWGGFIDDAADFDAAYFGIDERTAGYLDPLARKALEVGAECLRDAGYREDGLKGRRVGVYLGTRSANYREYLRPLPREAIVGLNQNFIAAHLSHFLDLSGPNLVVDSACSSSLVTVHLACQSLALGETELALAGGVDLLLDEDPYLLLSEGKALSPTGRCHTFDEAADGFVPGEGAGMVLLKRLDHAERDGDRVLAVIEAGAVNNDGRTMGYTTPSVRAQRELIQEALERGGIDPRTIGYVETHGTGTMIGDPIELQALTTAYRRYTADTAFCGVGSVKTNVGHLLSAAGVAGLIKVVLALRHQRIPPTLNCVTPNPRFAFPESPFHPVTEARDFSSGPALERAAVSSFGFGGTNAHLILRRAADGARATGYASRQPLPPPAYDRKAIWPLKKEPPYPKASAPLNEKKRSARLDLTFLPTG